MKLRMTLAFALLGLCLGAASSAGAAEPLASRCPSERLEEGTFGDVNHNPAAKKAMVPKGATSVRVCRYWGFDNAAGKQTPRSQARAGKLRDEGTDGGRDLLESLTLEFEELGSVKPGSYNCPEDEGATLYAAFSYPTAAPVVVEIKLSGCEFVNNGHALTRSSSTSLEKRLERLAEGISGIGKSPPAVAERRAIAFPPPHLSYVVAKRLTVESLAEACRVSEICSSSKIVDCTRKDPATFACRYLAELKTGEICRGPIAIHRISGSGPISISPGAQSEDEGECFFLFAPPGFKEELEEEEREEEREAKPGKPPRG